MVQSDESGSVQVSVIIPTCDRGDLVREAIESAMAQSLKPVEILVVDNGKSDLVLDSPTSMVQLHRLPPRVGPSRARNYGAAIAKSEYVAFLDDDDWWDPNFLQEAVRVMKQDGSRCVYGRKDIIKNGRRQVYKVPDKEKLTVAALSRRNPGTGGINVVIERKLFLSIGGFDSRLRMAEDQGLALEVLLHGETISVASDASAIVRFHRGTRLRQHPIQKLGFLWKYRKLVSLGFFGISVIRICLRELRETVRRPFRRAISIPK